MKYENGSYELNKDELKALLAFASKDTARTGMTMLFFDKGSVVTTDGHSMLVLTAPPAGDEVESEDKTQPYGVSRDMLTDAMKLLKKDDELTVVPPNGKGMVKLVTPHAVLQAEKSPHEFPPYRSVLPTPRNDTRELGVPRFDANLLARIALMQKAVGVDWTDVHFTAVLDPALYVSESLTCIGHAAVMPMNPDR